MEEMRNELAIQETDLKNFKKKSNKLQHQVNELKDELRSMQLENDSYKMFLTGEHKSLLVKDRTMQQKALDMVQGGHSMKRDSLMREKIEKLEDDLINMSVYAYTMPGGIQTHQESAQSTPQSPTKSPKITINFSVRGSSPRKGTSSPFKLRLFDDPDDYSFSTWNK